MGGRSGAIRFHNDRYRLDPTVVGWSDLDAFDAALGRAIDATVPTDRLAALEEARGLYRGDYLDDCPYYGDSADVEDRRARIRARYADALGMLVETYTAAGDRVRAQEAQREVDGHAERVRA